MIETISKASVLNKNVLIRVDLNVPFEGNKVSDLSRMVAILPTINHVIKKGGRPILMSHLGRPTSQDVGSHSLSQLLPNLRELLDIDIIFCKYLDEKSIRALIKKTPKTKLILLENIRFFEGEETNSPKLSKMLAGFGELFCNDAFSVSHRSHASTVGVANHLPSYSGLLLDKELTALERLLIRPKKPIVAVIGGSKVSTKITLLNHLIKKVDHIVIGGSMANTFLFAKKKEIGISLCERGLINIAKEILTNAKNFNCKIHLPLDIVCATTLNAKVKPKVYEVNACPKNKMILDSGPKTVANIKNTLEMSKTLIWNGPLGAFEIVPYNTSTDAVAVIASKLTKEKKLLSIAGGGDTVSSLNSSGVASDFSYVSNAGGAFLEWLEGKSLPGLTALTRNF